MDCGLWIGSGMLKVGWMSVMWPKYMNATEEVES